MEQKLIKKFLSLWNYIKYHCSCYRRSCCYRRYLYYTHSQVNQLNTKIASLEKQILDLTNILKHLSPHSFLQSPTTQSPQSTPQLPQSQQSTVSLPKRANSNLHIHQLHKKIFTLLINKQ